MLEIYYRVGRNANKASKQYALEHPHVQRKPGRRNFIRLTERVRRTGNVKLYFILGHKILIFLKPKAKNIYKFNSSSFIRNKIKYI